jgi:mercuric ion transport protein
MTVSHFPAAKGSSGARPARNPAGSLAGLSALAGVGAVAASSCCVLPLVLAGLGAGGAVLGGLGALAAYQTPILAAALALLAGGWIAFWRRTRAAACAADGVCARPETPRRTLAALLTATLLVGAGAGWTFIEPVLPGAI